jgi:hypothetical protein
MTIGGTFIFNLQTRFYSAFLILKQEVLGRTNRLLSFIRQEPNRKRRVQQFFNCCVYIRCRGNVFAKPNNDSTYTYTD